MVAIVLVLAIVVVGCLGGGCGHSFDRLYFVIITERPRELVRFRLD